MGLYGVTTIHYIGFYKGRIGYILGFKVLGVGNPKGPKGFGFRLLLGPPKKDP